MTTTTSDFLTNEVGDVYAVVINGHEEPVDPDEWGWTGISGRYPVEERRSLDDVRSLPGFKVTVTDNPDCRIVPGRKPSHPPRFCEYDDGAAPGAFAVSTSGTSVRCDRLSDALTWPTRMLPKYPHASPVKVYDILRGRLIEVEYTPPPPTPGGEGRVYLLEDGNGVKIGYTTLSVEKRVMELQVGNSRLIGVIATISPASENVEAHLQGQFEKWRVRGEWFDRSHLLALAREAGGWANLVRRRLPPGDWQIMLYPPYG